MSTCELCCVLSNFHNKLLFFIVTPRSTVRLQKQIIASLVKNSPSCYTNSRPSYFGLNLPQNGFYDKSNTADSSGRAVYGVGLRQLACWDCRFESYWGHGYLSIVSVVICQVEVSAMGRSLVQGSPTVCVVEHVQMQK
jgi:hypothetical protein